MTGASRSSGGVETPPPLGRSPYARSGEASSNGYLPSCRSFLPPLSDGPIVGHAPFRTTGRLRRAHVTSATGFPTAARATPPLVAAAVSLLGHYAAPFGWSVSINVCALWSYSSALALRQADRRSK